MEGEILIIEDEDKIARVLELELQHEGYRTRHAADGKEGFSLIIAESWDLVLLDIMLPEMSGLEVLRRMRQAEKTAPVILLTAKNTVPDKVSGFHLGANDYITKPFAIEELLARIRNILSLTSPNPEAADMYHVGDLTMNMKTRRVVRANQSIELTPREFDLLTFLARNKEHVVSREDILSEVWGYEFVGDTNVVDVYIRYLRQKIDQGFKHKLIQTSRGVGYVMTEAAK